MSFPARVPRSALILRALLGGCVGLAFLLTAGAVAAAPKGDGRIALLIGNASYKKMAPLRNPVNDARDLGATLKKLGFDVTVETNLGEDEMKLAIRRFARKLEQTKDGVGFFYYAGHGVEVRGENYLIPVGADIPNEEYVDLRAVSLREITAGLRSAENRLNVVVLDACRDNPFAGRFRSASRGLKAIPEREMPAETLIAFSAGSGQVASDGASRNSPFAEALIREVQQPGVRLVDVFRNVKRRVRDATDGNQNPWQRDDLTLTSKNAFYFVPPESAGPTQLARIEPRRPKAPGGFSLDDLDSAAAEEEATREEWLKQRTEMEAAYATVEAYEKRRVSDALKLAAWERFASAYTEDDPFSRRDNELRTQARQRMDALRPKYASLVVRSNVSGDLVKIDGRSVGSTGPQTHQLDPGRYRVRVEKDGYKPHEETIQLAAADRRVIAAELTRMIETAAKGMVRVPAGDFFSGCNERVDSECFDDEKPGRTRTLAAFSIDAREVTVAEFRECVDRGPCSAEGLDTYDNCTWNQTGSGNHPISCVDWHRANQYCRYRGKRLPTEWEWEKAARGTDGRKYPWGNGSYASRSRPIANLSNSTKNHKDGYSRTAPVGSFPEGASPYGALDMMGNVWEWTSSTYRGTESRVVRGGSWSSRPWYVRASYRSSRDPGIRHYDVGFRCAQ